MTDPASDKEILVVASKITKYVRSIAGMSTSANVLPKLSDTIRSLCNQAIENSRADGRKTVMDRDFT